jgi:hypothetical protein
MALVVILACVELFCSSLEVKCASKPNERLFIKAFIASETLAQIFKHKLYTGLFLSNLFKLIRCALERSFLLKGLYPTIKIK